MKSLTLLCCRLYPNSPHPLWLIQLIPHTTQFLHYSHHSGTIRRITDETLSAYTSARHSVNGFALNFFCYKLCTRNKVHYYVIWKSFYKRRDDTVLSENTEWRKSCLSDNRWCDNQWGNPGGAFASILKVTTNINTTDTAAVDTSKVGSKDISSSSASVLVPVLPHQIPVIAWNIIAQQFCNSLS